MERKKDGKAYNNVDTGDAAAAIAMGGAGGHVGSGWEAGRVGFVNLVHFLLGVGEGKEKEKGGEKCILWGCGGGMFL